MPRTSMPLEKKIVEDSVVGQVPDHEPATPYLQQAPASFKPFSSKGIYIFLALLLITFGWFLYGR